MASRSGSQVYLDGEVFRPVEGVVDVWTWRAYPAPHQSQLGTVYDRVLTRDPIYCLLETKAPLQMVRYLGRASVDSFMFPPSVGPFGWGPGSTEEAVAEIVCEADVPGLEVE